MSDKDELKVANQQENLPIEIKDDIDQNDFNANLVPEPKDRVSPNKDVNNENIEIVVGK